MGKYLLVAILYIDDLIILESNVTQLKWLKLEFEKEFEMSDLGELYYCLGVEFERSGEACIITMNQMSYIQKILKCFQHERMQTGQNFVRCEFKIVKTSK